MNFPAQDLSLRHISQSYQSLLQQHGEYVLDGLGTAIFTIGSTGSGANPVSLLQSNQTSSMTVSSASYAQTSVFASSSLTSVFSEYSDSASVAVYADVAGLSATASIAQFAISASYAPGAPSISSSYSDYAAVANSSSYALTASYILGGQTDTASYSIFSETASHAPNYIKKSGDVATGDIIGTDFVKTRSGTITRDVNGNVSTVSLTGGRTLTISRTSEYISSMTDGARTWTYTRNLDNLITGWAVT